MTIKTILQKVFFIPVNKEIDIEIQQIYYRLTINHSKFLRLSIEYYLMLYAIF